MSLRSLVNGSFRGMIGRALSGGGLALVSYGVLAVAITNALALLVNNLSAVPSEMFNFLLLSGVGDGISIIGAAILTRNAFDAKLLGLGKST